MTSREHTPLSRSPAALARRAAMVALLAGTALAAAAHGQTLTEYSLPPAENGFGFASAVQGRDGYLYGIMGGNTPTIYIASPGGTMTSQLVGSINPSYYICTTGMILGRDGNFYGTCSMAGNGTQDFAFRYTPGGYGVQGTFTPFAVITPTANQGTRSPSALVQASDGNFYGTTFGGSGLAGSVFRITPAGVVTTFKTFSGGSGTGPYYPTGPLIQAKDGNLYGTSEEGSSVCCGFGTIWRLTLKGKVSVFHNFDGTANVASPDGGVVQGTDGAFYGITTFGGANDQGSIWKVSAAGAVTNLHDVSYTDDGSAYPQYRLVQATDGNFYGELTGCAHGGCLNGLLFSITSAGAFTPLFTIVEPSGGCQYALPGCIPNSSLIEHTNGTLYGVLEQGGDSDWGALYAETPAVALHPNVSLQESSGAKGSTVDILGQGFSSATSVKFGKMSASFTAVSDTYLTATVPAHAKSGYVTVAEPGGTLQSTVKFKVK